MVGAPRLPPPSWAAGARPGPRRHGARLHGRSPIEVVGTAVGHWWLLEVTDAAEDTPPIPDQERDAALGGLVRQDVVLRRR